MSLYKKFKTNDTVEREGVWLEYSKTEKIRIARAGGSNTAFTKRLESLQKKYQRQIDLGVLDDEISQQITLEAYADTIILDWVGICDSDGNQLPFNRDNVIKVCGDLPDLFLDIVNQSRNARLFREYLDEEAAKN